MNELRYFEIQSTDPERDVDFYTSVFGWRFTRDANVSIEYYRLEGAGVRGALLRRPAAIPPKKHGTNAFTCLFQVEDFERTAKAIGDKGGAVAMPKFAIPGVAWQGYFLDPDHNVFGIFQHDDQAR